MRCEQCGNPFAPWYDGDTMCSDCRMKLQDEVAIKVIEAMREKLKTMTPDDVEANRKELELLLLSTKTEGTRH